MWRVSHPCNQKPSSNAATSTDVARFPPPAIKKETLRPALKSRSHESAKTCMQAVKEPPDDRKDGKTSGPYHTGDIGELIKDAVAAGHPDTEPVDGRFARHSLFWQPRPSDAFEQGRNIRRDRLEPLDRKFGIEAAGFRQGGLRLFHLAYNRVSGCQIDVGHEIAKAKLD